MLAIHAFSSLLWLWDAQAKHGFASCVEFMLSSCFCRCWCWKCKPCSPGMARATAASHLPTRSPSARVVSRPRAAFTLRSPHPRPLCHCVPARSSAGEKGCECGGVKCYKENLLWVTGCSAALRASAVAVRDPGSCSPGRSHGDTEAFLPAAARFGGGTLHVHGSLPTHLFP